MKSSRTLVHVIMPLSLALAGCGGDDGPDGPPSDAGRDGSSASDAASDASGDATGGSALPDVNGCTQATAMDFTSTALTITFPSLAYTPKCARIRAGQSVTFSGTFSSHPLRAGSVSGGVATPASGSPIASTSTGSSASFTFPATGAYPYYCQFHLGAGMFGAIYVEP